MTQAEVVTDVRIKAGFDEEAEQGRGPGVCVDLLYPMKKRADEAAGVFV